MGSLEHGKAWRISGVLRFAAGHFHQGRHLLDQTLCFNFTAVY